MHKNSIAGIGLFFAGRSRAGENAGGILDQEHSSAAGSKQSWLILIQWNQAVQHTISLKAIGVLVLLLGVFGAFAGMTIAAPSFIQNKGQWPAPVLYSTEMPQGWLFLEKTGFSYSFMETDYFEEKEHASGEEFRSRSYRGHAFRVAFVNANPNTAVTSQKALSGYHNYFIGNDPAAWATQVQAFQEVQYHNLFPGIDLKLYASGNNLKYDYLLAPHANIAAIQLRYVGAKRMSIKNGRLYILTSVNEMVEEKPFAYQDQGGTRREVACEFTLTNNQVGFRITGPYDPDKPLVIDPELIFLTYSGSSSPLSGNCATGDSYGNTYFASRLMGQQYPVTEGAFQTVRRANHTAISKLSSRGNSLLFATYLGGGGNNEYPLAMTVNRQNELIIVGFTNSPDFPTTAQAYDRTFNGIRDYYITRFNESGSSLVASTYLGGSAAEGGSIATIPAKVTLDNDGSIILGACSQSLDFPIRNGFQATKKAGQDGVVCKLNPNLSELLWSTFLGGNQDDYIFDVKIGASGKIYVGGSTYSNDFPATNGVLHRNLQGQQDGFLAIISSEGRQLLAATYVGTAQNDLVKSIDLDRIENVYAAGHTNGSYPITAGTYGTPNSTGGYFIHKFNPSLSSTLMSTHIGSNFGIERPPVAFAVSECKDIFLAGFSPANAPTTADAMERNRKTMYVCHLSDDGKQLAYASYMGGSDINPHTHLANTGLITKTGTLYQAECTYSRDQPVTPAVYDTDYNGSPDVAVTKFQFTPAITNLIQARVTTPPISCAPYPVQFNNQTTNAISYNWNFGDGTAGSSQENPLHTFQNPGKYRVRLIASNPESCRLFDTTFVTVTVAAPPVATLPEQAVYLCFQAITLDAGNPGYNYRWSTGATSQTIEVTEPGPYELEISLGDCSLKSVVTVQDPLPPLVVPNIFTPNRDGKNDYFYIKNGGANTKLKIFNRWGKLIYENNNYQNNWDGSNVSLGSYYYIVESTENCSSQKGWFEIVQ